MLRLRGNLTALMLALERAAHPDQYAQALTGLAAYLRVQTDSVKRAVRDWIAALLARLGEPQWTAEIVDHMDTEGPMLLAKRFQEWKQALRVEGLQAGRLEGELEGERKALRKLLEHRFGTLPEREVQRLAAAASVAQIEAWYDRALTAQRLEDVFVDG